MTKFSSARRIFVPCGNRLKSRKDSVIVEEPLEIIINGKQFAVTMRTPGDDIQLVTGLLHNEGIIRALDDIKRVDYCSKDMDAVEVVLAKRKKLIRRSLITNSSCGVCGKELIDTLLDSKERLHGKVRVMKSVIKLLPSRIRKQQTFFRETGGSHAAGLFDLSGELILCKEDVGRHNAVDKLIGELFIREKLPLEGKIMLVSGRTSFEIIQKAFMSSIPVVCSVSAASSLAIELAKKVGITVIGMIRGRKFNVYSLNGRII